MKSLKDIKNLINKIVLFESEMVSIREELESLLKDDNTEMLLDPDEYKKRKKRERNQRFYKKNREKHW